MLREDKTFEEVLTPVRNHKVITAILFWSALVITSGLYMTIPLISVFAEVFSVSSGAAAWTSSAFTLCLAIGCLVHGPLSERFGRKTVLLGGVLLLAGINLLTAFTNNLPLLIVCRGLQGFAAATFSSVALPYVAESFEEEKRVTIIGFISSGFLLAGVIGQVFSGYLNEQYNWNTVFLVSGVIYAMTFVLMLRYLPNSDKIAPSASHGTFWRMFSLFKQNNLVHSYIIALTLLLTFVGMYTVLNSYLSSSYFSLSAQEILYVRMAGMLGMLLSPFAGKFVEKLGALKVLRSGLFLGGASLALLGLGKNLQLLILLSVLFVASISLVVPTLINLIGQMAGNSRGIALSLYTFIMPIGASIGPILATLLLGQGNYSFTFYLLAFCSGIALLSSFLIRQVEK